MVLDGVHGQSLWDSWGPWGSLRISYLKITRPWEAGPCWFWEALVRSLRVLEVLGVCSESVIEAIGPWKGLGCFWGFLGRSLGVLGVLAIRCESVILSYLVLGRSSSNWIVLFCTLFGGDPTYAYSCTSSRPYPIIPF